ncbi:hypothetical protein ACQKNX_22705 [Lysinibacillus sp. NPDC093712]|uniref:hypothetical protein n=1 Tax=Lysinibacillus sp. NPDC093712 TaxID=3390579 RepID=UPI003CFDCC73
MKSSELLVLNNEQQNIKKSIAFLESEYRDLNVHIIATLINELEVCQSKIMQLEKPGINNTERQCL